MWEEGSADVKLGRKFGVRWWGASRDKLRSQALKFFYWGEGLERLDGIHVVGSIVMTKS